MAEAVYRAGKPEPMLSKGNLQVLYRGLFAMHPTLTFRTDIRQCRCCV
jgi:hypothetical protein